MKLITDVITLFDENYVDDLLQLGSVGYWSENSKYMDFLPLGTIYLKFKNRYISFSTYPFTGKLVMNLKDTINFDFEKQIDEDEVCCVSHIYSNLYGDSSEKNFINYFRLFYDKDEDLEKGLIQCIELGFKNGRSILIDPLNFNGLQIDIGGTLESWQKSKIAKFDCKEYFWERGLTSKIS